MALTLTQSNPYLSLTDGGYYFRVVGTDFVSGLTFTVGGVAGTVGYIENSNTFWGYTPIKAVGVYNLVVTLPDTQTATLTNAVTYIDNIEGYVPSGAPGGAIIPRRIDSYLPDSDFPAILKPNTLLWYVDNTGNYVVYGCVLSYVHKGESAFAPTDQWDAISPTYFRFNNTGDYYIAFRLKYRQYAYATLRPSGCADLTLSSTSAQTIRLSTDVLAYPDRYSKAIRLSTDVLAYPDRYSRAIRLGAGVVGEVANITAQLERLSIEVFTSINNTGLLNLIGYAPIINPEGTIVHFVRQIFFSSINSEPDPILVTVNYDDGSLALIYSDEALTQPITNPFSLDLNTKIIDFYIDTVLSPYFNVVLSGDNLVDTVTIDENGG